MDTVIFRRWRDSGEVIALFPEIPADIFGDYVEAFEHVGQHGGADFHGVIQATVPVELHEAEDLAERTDPDRLQLAANQAGTLHTPRKAAANGQGMRLV